MTNHRTHLLVGFANPYLTCEKCLRQVTGWHDNWRCRCTSPAWNAPCGHVAAAISVCPSWGPVDGCTCLTPDRHQMPVKARR